MTESPIYFERGGGWIGDGVMLWQATWPFSSISIYNNHVFLKVAFKTVELKMSQITEVRRTGLVPILADGVELIHTNAAVPKKLVFWSLGHGKKIQEIIQSNIL